MDEKNSLIGWCCLLAALMLAPLIIFTAVPNIFFGFETSEDDAQLRMAAQAKALGGAYLSLEDFERTQIDAVITTMIHEYEENGTVIDRVELSNSMEEDDLLWLIAVNSVARKQNLEEMSAEDVRMFCLSYLSFTPTLLGEASVTLKVDVRWPDPDQLMADLGFDDEAKIWAGVLHEVLSESGALENYKDHFEAYRPNYSGDTPSGGSLTRWLGGWWRWRRGRRIITYRGEAEQ